jgi:hypothetical protein
MNRSCAPAASSDSLSALRIIGACLRIARTVAIARLYRPLVFSETRRALHLSMVHPFRVHIALSSARHGEDLPILRSVAISCVRRCRRLGDTWRYDRRLAKKNTPKLRMRHGRNYFFRIWRFIYQ